MPLKKSKDTKETNSDPKEKMKEDLQEYGHEISDMMSRAKEKFKKSDPKTKKAIIAGLAGAAGLLAGAIGMKKHNKKKKSK